MGDSQALALTLAGGVGFRDPASGLTTRGEPHLLLIGDAGTGKSQFLKFTSRLIPRSVLTTGVGTTSAGLTCTAVRDSGEWMLEAGALVLADRGVCCIDEFGSIREHDRATIHEAMEQQTLSVAKAGLVCKLNARATVVAATNPKGKFDPNEDIVVNTAIGAPLLSRFDLVLVLLDQPDQGWDAALSSFILQNACHEGSSRLSQQQQSSSSGEHSSTPTSNPFAGGDARPASSAEGASVAARWRSLPVEEVGLVTATAQGCRDSTGRRKEDPVRHQREGQPLARWTMARLRAYFLHIRHDIEPSLSESAQEILQMYYTIQRRADDRNASRTTVRLLESLVRLAQAHARLLHRSEVSVQDAVVACQMVERSMHTAGIARETGVVQAEFAEDPDAEYVLEERQMLQKLGLAHLAHHRGDPPSSQPGPEPPTVHARSQPVHPQRLLSRELPVEARRPPPAMSQYNAARSAPRADGLARETAPNRPAEGRSEPNRQSQQEYEPQQRQQQTAQGSEFQPPAPRHAPFCGGSVSLPSTGASNREDTRQGRPHLRRCSVVVGKH